MPVELVGRNILILPSEEVTARAVALSTELAARFETAFVLNRTHFLPHITLYQLALPKAKAPELLSAVKKIIEKMTQRGAMRLTLKGYSEFGGSGIFWNVLEARSSPLLHLLHSHLMDERETIANLRQGFILPQHAGFIDGTGPDIGAERRLSLGRYGSPLAGETEWPHITLSAVKNSSDVEAALAMLPTDLEMEFAVRSIHITDVGPFGTCPGSLHEIPLT